MIDLTRRIRLIHGIHAPEGDHNMAALLPHLKLACPTADVSLFEYGFMGFWAARWRNDRVAGDLARSYHSRASAGGPAEEVWITHSNGAAVAYLACRDHGARPDMIVNLNPALDRWRAAPVPAVEVIHSAADRWVDVAQWLPGHIWGDQGKMGYGPTQFRKAQRKDIINHSASSADFGRMAYRDHTGLFAPKRVADWAQFIAHRIGERMDGIQE